MAMPEERHLLLKRMVRPHHPVGPPVGNPVRLEHAGAQPVEELVDDRLKSSVAGRFDLNTEGLAFLLGQIGHGGPAGREGFQARIVDAGMVERREVAVVDVLEMDESPDRFHRGQSCQRVDFLGCAAEARPLQQMGRQITVPVGGRDRREVVLPPGAAGGLGLARNRTRRREGRDSQCGGEPLQFAKHTGSSRCDYEPSVILRLDSSGINSGAAGSMPSGIPKKWTTSNVCSDFKTRFGGRLRSWGYEARLRGLLSWAILGAPEPAGGVTRCRTNLRAASRTSEIPPTRRMLAKQKTTGTDNSIILSAPEASLRFHPVLSAISLFWVSSTESRRENAG